MAKMNVLIVVYNKYLADSAAINSISRFSGVRIWIADNSTKDYGNRGFAEEHGYGYFDMGGNMGLSKAYNHVISGLDKTDDLVCLFDDDTTVDSLYFETLAAAAKSHPDINLFVPVVRDCKGILSPCIIAGAACRRVKDLSELPQQGVSVINSGLAIRLKVFKNYHYDEGQFLDYIDHAFIRDNTANSLKQIYIMSDVILEQQFSGSESLDRNVSMNRYNIFKADFRYFCKKYKLPVLEKWRVLLKHSISLKLKRIKD